MISEVIREGTKIRITLDVGLCRQPYLYWECQSELLADAMLHAVRSAIREENNASSRAMEQDYLRGYADGKAHRSKNP
jgi:hypothetical protein